MSDKCYCLMMRDIWNLMDGDILPTLISVHKTKRGAIAERKSWNKLRKTARERRGIKYSIEERKLYD